MDVSSGEAGGVEAIVSGESGAATEAGRSRGERCLPKADAANGTSPRLWGVVVSMHSERC